MRFHDFLFFFKGQADQERALKALQDQVTVLEKASAAEKENTHAQAEAKEQVVELTAQVRNVRNVRRVTWHRSIH